MPAHGCRPLRRGSTADYSDDPDRADCRYSGNALWTVRSRHYREQLSGRSSVKSGPSDSIAVPPVIGDCKGGNLVGQKYIEGCTIIAPTTTLTRDLFFLQTAKTDNSRIVLREPRRTPRGWIRVHSFNSCTESFPATSGRTKARQHLGKGRMPTNPTTATKDRRVGCGHFPDAPTSDPF
jgi:hypothetical protein